MRGSILGIRGVGLIGLKGQVDPGSRTYRAQGSGVELSALDFRVSFPLSGHLSRGLVHHAGTWAPKTFMSDGVC